VFLDQSSEFQGVERQGRDTPTIGKTCLDKLEYLPFLAPQASIQGAFHSKLSLEAGKHEGGISVDPVKTLENRTRSKSLDYVIKGRLMNEPAIKETSPLHRNYVKSTACNGVLTQEGGKIKAFYCKERWCSVCNRIRTGILFNKYEQVIDTWDDKYFVTLTLVSPTPEELPQTIDLMIKLFGMCAQSIKQTKNLEFQAVRKIEVTYNIHANTYNPHIHAIVKGKEQADALQKYWLQKVNKRRDEKSIEKCQPVIKCDNNTVKELFKYFTKLINDQMLYPKALDTIFRAMRGRRTFQAYLPKHIQNKIKQKCEDDEIVLDRSTAAIKRLSETIHWDYTPEAKNFVDKKTGDLLTQYKPTETFERLLKQLEGKEAAKTEESDNQTQETAVTERIEGEQGEASTQDSTSEVWHWYNPLETWVNRMTGELSAHQPTNRGIPGDTG